MQKLEPYDSRSISFFERRRRVRRVRMIVDLTANIIHGDDSMTYREATSLVTCARKAILELMPHYEERFERVIRPRFDALIHQRWPLEHVGSSQSAELVN